LEEIGVLGREKFREELKRKAIESKRPKAGRPGKGGI